MTAKSADTVLSSRALDRQYRTQLDNKTNNNNMKRFGHLFEQAFSEDNLIQAFKDAEKGKRSSPKVFDFRRELIGNLDALHQELWKGEYEPKPYHVFLVYEPKPRIIFSPHFRDVVVQHAIYRVIYEIFDRTFIHQSYGSRKGGGTHRASDYAQQSLRATPGKYLLQLDIERFFYSIDHEILKDQLAHKIKDKRLLEVIFKFVWYVTEGVGVPIGNLLSQLFALIYMSPLDHFIKRDLKVKRYCRYVDDFILFGLTKEQAYTYKEKVKEYLRTKLELRLSKWRVARTEQGVNFVGYRTWASRRFVRKHSLYKIKRRARARNIEAVTSLLAHARHTSSYTYMQQLIKEKFNGVYIQLPKVYQQHPHSRA